MAGVYRNVCGSPLHPISLLFAYFPFIFISFLPSSSNWLRVDLTWGPRDVYNERTSPFFFFRLERWALPSPKAYRVAENLSLHHCCCCCCSRSHEQDETNSDPGIANYENALGFFLRETRERSNQMKELFMVDDDDSTRLGKMMRFQIEPSERIV